MRNSYEVIEAWVCECDGCWCCEGSEPGCTCDIDWDDMYEHSNME